MPNRPRQSLYVQVPSYSIWNVLVRHNSRSATLLSTNSIFRYHSHFSNQYGDGVVGPMVFHGPAAANYDIDLGPYALTDWYAQRLPASRIYADSFMQVL